MRAIIIAILASVLLAWALATVVRGQALPANHGVESREANPVAVLPLRAHEVPTKAAIERFEMSVTEYLSVRARAVRNLPPLLMEGELTTLVPAIELHIRAVRKARASARAGDVFKPDVAAVFRELIATSLRDHRMTVSEILAQLEFDAPSAFRAVRVNDRLPWLRSASVPIRLDGLPQLPDFLGYRLVDRNLVLLDVDLALVVDVLVDALPMENKGARAPQS